MAETEERKRLEDIAQVSRYAEGVSATSVRYSFEVFLRFIRGPRVLEMGPAEGVMTEHLAGLGLDLTLLEGSALFCEDLARRFPAARVVNGLFETAQLEGPFDTVVLGHVLEHVEDPVATLARAKGWLAPGGRVLAAVPNSRSLHRQAAVLLGMLAFEEELNELDRHHGHRRVYNPETLRRDVLRAGLRIEHFGGYWIKPLSNGQIEASWTPEMVWAFMQLGERYPDHAAEIYVVATR